MKIQLGHSFNDIINVDNLLEAWHEFNKDKRKRKDVQEFDFHLMDNVLTLHNDLSRLVYKHGGYYAFTISDPKPRHIHKALVRDRLLHHGIHRILYPFFDKTFIADSFSCRISKGTHKALNRFRDFSCQVSHNHAKTCWVLKCDVKKFFANIDHRILLGILSEYIPDTQIMWLLERVIASFSSSRAGVGLPIGNLISQLFCNIYMNEFDQFIKHKLRSKYYIRYADDFVLLSENREWLHQQIPKISEFLENRLKLTLHPDKVSIKTLASGVDFLGWVHFTNHRVLRTTTKKRMMRRIQEHPTEETLQSYLGLLKHGNTYGLQEEIIKFDSRHWL